MKMRRRVLKQQPFVPHKHLTILFRRNRVSTVLIDLSFDPKTFLENQLEYLARHHVIFHIFEIHGPLNMSSGLNLRRWVVLTFEGEHFSSAENIW